MATNTTIQADIQLNAKQATEEVDKFGNAVEGADKDVQKLNKDLDKSSQEMKNLGKESNNVEKSIKSQEARIKTLDGAINIVGGSVELLAGGLVTLGLVSGENAEKLQAIALAAISVGDGSKRLFDGIKSLTEGRKQYSEVLGENIVLERENTSALTSNANAAGAITKSATNASGAIVTETSATAANTVGKGNNTISIVENTQSKIQNLVATGALTTAEEKKLAASLGLTLAELRGVAVIRQKTVATEQLTIAQRIQQAGEKAWAKLSAISLSGWVAIAIAIGSAIAIYKQFTSTQNETAEATKKFNDTLQQLNKTMREQQAIAGVNANSIGVLSQAYVNGNISIQEYTAALKKLGIDLTDVNLATAENIKLVNDLATVNNNIASSQAKRAEAEGRLKAALEANRERLAQTIRDEIAALDVASAKYYAQRDAILANFEGQKLLLKSSEELVKQTKIEIATYIELQEITKNAVETWIELSGGIQETTNAIARQLPYVTALEDKLGRLYTKADKGRLTLAETFKISSADYVDWLNYLLVKQTEFFETTTSDAISGTLQTAATFTRTLAEVQDDSSEEAFEASKKYKIASVVTSAIQSSFDAYAAAQQFGPYLGPILGAAQVAAIAIASNKAIQDIQNSQFGGNLAPAGAVASTPSPAAQRALNPQFAQGGFLAPQSTTPTIVAPEQPIQAYVLASDVTLGLQAYGQIGRRRRFG